MTWAFGVEREGSYGVSGVATGYGERTVLRVAAGYAQTWVAHASPLPPVLQALSPL